MKNDNKPEFVITKHYKVITILLIGFIVAYISSISYAYFSVEPDNTKNQSITESAGSMKVTYTDCANSRNSDCAYIDQEMTMGSSITKSFRVENTGTLTTSYYIRFETLQNSFVNNELTYIFSTLGGTTLVQETPLPYGSQTNVNVYRDTLAPGASKEYKFVFKFLDISSGNNESNTTASFTVKLGITGD